MKCLCRISCFVGVRSDRTNDSSGSKRGGGRKKSMILLFGERRKERKVGSAKHLAAIKELYLRNAGGS